MNYEILLREIPTGENDLNTRSGQLTIRENMERWTEMRNDRGNHGRQNLWDGRNDHKSQERLKGRPGRGEQGRHENRDEGSGYVAPATCDRCKDCFGREARERPVGNTTQERAHEEPHITLVSIVHLYTELSIDGQTSKL